jgi:hypothetical protein
LELSLDFGSGEVAVEGGVVDLVVVDELAERFAGGPGVEWMPPFRWTRNG